MARLLIVDDERNIRRNLVAFFESCGHDASGAASAGEALRILDENIVDLVLTDFRMAEMNGLELLREVKRRRPETLVILMTAYATVENAVVAIKAGAYDYVTKPFSLTQIQHVVERAIEFRAIQLENQTLRDTVEEVPLLDSRSPAMLHALDTARRAAQTDATILLTGESGTGKNVLAKQIHQWSPRRERAFVVVNCTTLSEQLLESELFGHMRGAFTGAIKDKPGRLEAADGGTVFLDEIADLSPGLQTKFLRFIQEHDFERLGSDLTIRVDARIIAASNRDLESEVVARRFREDLYYRLNVITLHLPALRERKADILPLAERLMRTVAIRNRRPPVRLSSEAASAVAHYHWPGNVRELRNALERAVVLSSKDTVGPEDLPDAIFRPAPKPSSQSANSAPSLEQVEREHITRVLAESATLEEAAATLGINTTTLWRKRKRFGID